MSQEEKRGEHNTIKNSDCTGCEKRIDVDQKKGK